MLKRREPRRKNLKWKAVRFGTQPRGNHFKWFQVFWTWNGRKHVYFCLIAAENLTFSAVLASGALANIHSGRLVAGYQEHAAIPSRFFRLFLVA